MSIRFRFDRQNWPRDFDVNFQDANRAVDPQCFPCLLDTGSEYDIVDLCIARRFGQGAKLGPHGCVCTLDVVLPNLGVYRTDALVGGPSRHQSTVRLGRPALSHYYLYVSGPQPGDNAVLSDARIPDPATSLHLFQIHASGGVYTSSGKVVLCGPSSHSVFHQYFLIDTGAKVNVVRPDRVYALGLCPHVSAPNQHGIRSCACDIEFEQWYIANLAMEIKFTSDPPNQLQPTILVGRPVLELHEFQYAGPDNVFIVYQ